MEAPKLQTVGFAEYLTHSAVSRSELWTLHNHSPYYYRWNKLHGEHEDTAALRYGSALHEAVLEPDRFEGRWGCYDGVRNQRHKAYQEFLVDSGLDPQNVLSPSEWKLLEATRDRVRSLPGPATLLEQGKAEQSVFWIDEPTGLECKARFDFIDLERGIAVDLKTSKDIGIDELGKSFAKYGYALQAVHYMESMRAMAGQPMIDWENDESLPPFYFLIVSKEAPIEVALFELNRSDLQKAASLRRSMLDLLKKCMESNNWPGIPHEIQTLNLPAWAWKGVA